MVGAQRSMDKHPHALVFCGVGTSPCNGLVLARFYLFTASFGHCFVDTVVCLGISFDRQ